MVQKQAIIIVGDRYGLSYYGHMVRENLTLLMEEGRVVEDKGWFIPQR